MRKCSLQVSGSAGKWPKYIVSGNSSTYCAAHAVDGKTSAWLTPSLVRQVTEKGVVRPSGRA